MYACVCFDNFDWVMYLGAWFKGICILSIVNFLVWMKLTNMLMDS